MNPATHLLIVEDNPSLAELLREYLEAHGFRVTVECDGHAGLRSALHLKPDLLILDVLLPGLGGLEVLRQLRYEANYPVLMLTARDSEAEKVLGLELGADDYVTKPFSMAELLARVGALLRRTGAVERNTVLSYGLLELDPRTRTFTVNSVPVYLTRVEYDLMQLFLLHPLRVFNRSELLLHIQEGGEGSERTIDVHIRNLRTKIEADPKRPRWLETVYGVGYRLAGG